MIDEEPSVRDEIMVLYLMHGERVFDIDQENTFGVEFDRRYFIWANPSEYRCPLIKITPEALKLIGKET